jgi:threonylcarbamoyladenosine tRNA methylthiotransferase MtaB
MGCYAQLKPEEVSSIEGVDAVFGQDEKYNIPNLINNIIDGEKSQVNVSCIDDLLFHEATTYDNESRTRAFLKLQDGCDYHCTFCTIPFARGRSRSMPFDKIPQQFKKVAEGGYKEAVISGINLGDYKVPTGENFTDVVKLIDSSKYDLRIRISSIEPNLLTDDIINVVANENKFVPHFHIPLQSGSPEILKKMKRRYKVDYYRELIHKIKTKIPHCAIGVDVIVGFPGETDQHYRQTYDLLEELPVSYLHVFTYSERELTPAAKYSNPVPERIRKERTIELRELSEKKKHDFYASQIGSIKKVIPESIDEKTGRWKGWTENYIRVLLDAPEDIDKLPKKVILNELIDDYVYAELI